MLLIIGGINRYGTSVACICVKRYFFFDKVEKGGLDGTG